MRSQRTPNTDDPMLELGRLRHRQQTLAKRRELVVERVAWYPNDVNRRELASLDDEQHAISARIAELRTLLDEPTRSP